MRANHNAHDKFIKKTHLAKNEALATAAMRDWATAEKQKGQQRAKPSWEVDDLVFEEPKFVRPQSCLVDPGGNIFQILCKKLQTVQAYAVPYFNVCVHCTAHVTSRPVPVCRR